MSSAIAFVVLVLTAAASKILYGAYAQTLQVASLDYAQQYSPEWSREQYDMNLTELYRKRQGVVTISRIVEIPLPIDEVFDAVTTLQMWRICYPNTLAVGGITHRPFARGDLLLERFLFSGLIFNQFRYEVDELDKPTRALFHGKIIMANEAMQVSIGEGIEGIGGSFEYDLVATNDTSTKWRRNVHLYRHRDNPATHVAFSAYLVMVRDSQERGASLFVQCVRDFLQSKDYKRELYGSAAGPGVPPSRSWFGA